MTPAFAVHRKALPNALNAIVARMPHAQTATVAWAVRVGSRDELPRQAGISHFVEHLKFRGTARFPTEADVQAALQGLGAIFNATTGREHTIFWIEVQTARLPEAIQMLAEIARPSTFNGLEVERRIILHEVSAAQDDEGVLYDLHDAALIGLFPNEPFGAPMIGSSETVKATTIDDLKAFVARHYVAENSVLVVAGDVDPADAFGRLEKAFADLPRGPVPKRRPAPKAAPSRLVPVQWHNGRTDALLAFALPAVDVREMLGLEMLAFVLGPPGLGRLYKSLRSKAGLAYSCGCQFASYSDMTLVTVELNVATGKLPQAMDEILGHLVELRDRGPTPAELAVARSLLDTRVASACHAPTQLASWLTEAALEGRPVPAEEYNAVAASLTCDELQGIAQRLFAPGNGQLIARGEPAPSEYEVAWGKWVKALGK